jgi:hypothetical protein
LFGVLAGVEREAAAQPARQPNLPVGTPVETAMEEDGSISELLEEQVYPSVVAPVEIQPGNEDLFHLDAGFITSLSSNHDRNCNSVDYNWSYRAAGAALRPHT